MRARPAPRCAECRDAHQAAKLELIELVAERTGRRLARDTPTIGSRVGSAISSHIPSAHDLGSRSRNPRTASGVARKGCAGS